MTKATTTKAATQKDLARAEELMREYAQLHANKKALMDRIKNELDAYVDGIKRAEAELLEIGNRNLEKFDGDNNLQFEHGYLHIAENAVVKTTKKYDAATFMEVFPDFIDVKLKTGEIKKAWINKDTNKDLRAHGVHLDTKDTMQVLLNK